MKLNYKILTVILGMAFTASAQNWDLNGNNLVGGEKLGSTNSIDLGLYTNNIQRITLKTDGKFGLGTTNPRAWEEIWYCPRAGSKEGGLFVTKNNCKAWWLEAVPDNPDIIGGGIFELDPDGGGNEPEPDTEPPFILPFNFLTGHSTNVTTPLYSLNDDPMFWVRTEDPNPSPVYSGPAKFDTKLIVMSDGSVGVNIAKPRAALDVRGSQSPNRPAAIFGSRALGTGGNTGPNGLFQYYTQQIQIVPVLHANGYNRISQANDQGIFFSDGKGREGSNKNGALILAPWSESNNLAVGGMRMDKFGNVDFHGNVRALKFKVEPQWWSDFVFADDYRLMELTELECFIKNNRHLPNMPSENEICADGIDVAAMQAMQQQKIEELTLYVIEQQKQIIELKKLIDTLKQ
jgi:hypothetical protein